MQAQRLTFVESMQLMMPAESAHDTVEALGEVGLLQFKDLNKDKSAFQRTFANQVFKRACPYIVQMAVNHNTSC